MQISVSGMGKFITHRRQLKAVTAVLSVALLFALVAEVSHAHEVGEPEYECEICLIFSSSDEVLTLDCLADFSEVGTECNYFHGHSLSKTPLIQANSRGPPQFHSTIS